MIFGRNKDLQKITQGRWSKAQQRKSLKVAAEFKVAETNAETNAQYAGRFYELAKKIKENITHIKTTLKFASTFLGLEDQFLEQGSELIGIHSASQALGVSKIMTETHKLRSKSNLNNLWSIYDDENIPKVDTVALLTTKIENITRDQSLTPDERREKYVKLAKEIDQIEKGLKTGRAKVKELFDQHYKNNKAEAESIMSQFISERETLIENAEEVHKHVREMRKIARRIPQYEKKMFSSLDDARREMIDFLKEETERRAA